ncbi:MAG: hypothetical protein H6648_08645 [Caldilineae bacterium]|nr:hypothetical protein [Chloroflexota bacterium]MCB9177214.1 hypothetical protein [Caldilineae bacterium]
MQTDIATLIRYGMAVALFGLGLTTCALGIWTLLSREYQRTLKGISAQSSRLHARAMSEIGAVPLIDASARLVDAVNQLVRTAMGVGAFLSIIGTLLCVLAFWMFTF